MRNLKSVLAAAAMVSAVMIAPAAAAPATNLATTVQTTAAVPGVQDVRWVCGPRGCFWRPGPVWGPGWRGGWGPGWRGGWGPGWRGRRW